MGVEECVEKLFKSLSKLSSTFPCDAKKDSESVGDARSHAALVCKAGSHPDVPADDLDEEEVLALEALLLDDDEDLEDDDDDYDYDDEDEDDDDEDYDEDDEDDDDDDDDDEDDDDE